MELAELRTCLDKLGVVLADEDLQPSIRDVVAKQRLYRAVLYLDKLTEVKAYLNGRTNKQIQDDLGKEPYFFVWPGLRSPKLIRTLADTLDYWLVPAIRQEMTARGISTLDGYRAYFTAIIAKTDAERQDTVTDFFKGYPRTEHAFTNIVRNFKGNLTEGCRRLHDDRRSVQRLFAGRYPDLELDQVLEVTPSGSDSHKGGRQVLFFRVAGWYDLRSAPKSCEIRIVYKPANLTVDMMLFGDTTAVARVVGKPANEPVQRSLAEIVNDLPRTDPDTKIATYLILPMPPPPERRPDRKSEIRDAYGYMEMLWDPPGSPEPTRTDIAQFYRQLGVLSAIACTFSIRDLHTENVIAAGKRPYLVDLESSLTRDVASLTDTKLTTDTGGITANKCYTGDSAWCITEQAGTLSFKDTHIERLHGNRLRWKWPAPLCVPIDVQALLDGFTEGMHLLRKGLDRKAYDAWFECLINVVVRVVPIETASWKNTLRGLYGEYLIGDEWYTKYQAKGLVEHIKDVLQRSRMTNRTTPELCMAYAAGAVPRDLQGMDIPVFYHRIGTTAVVDSEGNDVTIPSESTAKSRLEGSAFYTEPPTRANVQQKLLADLRSQAEFTNRWAALRKEIRAAAEGAGQTQWESGLAWMYSRLR